MTAGHHARDQSGSAFVGQASSTWLWCVDVSVLDMHPAIGRFNTPSIFFLSVLGMTRRWRWEKVSRERWEPSCWRGHRDADFLRRLG